MKKTEKNLIVLEYIKLDVIITAISCYLERENCKVLNIIWIIYLSLKFTPTSFKGHTPISATPQSFKSK